MSIKPNNLREVIEPSLLFLLSAVYVNEASYNEARKAARRYGKKLLNAGCKKSFIDTSDVNLDIVPRDVPRFVQGDVQNLHMFGDKEFGAAYISHVLEHVDDPDAALKELHRVAEKVYVVSPFPLWPWSWFHPEHQWVIWGTHKICRVPTPLRKIAGVTFKATSATLRFCKLKK